MSPEQLRGEPVDARADVYALGVMGWQLITGDLPHPVHGDSPSALAHRKATQPLPEHPQIRGDLQRILYRALAPVRDQRLSSAQELAVRLRRFITHHPQPDRGLAPVYRVWLLGRRHPVWLASLVVICTVAAVIGIGRWHTQRQRVEARERHAAEQLEAAQDEIERLDAEGSWSEADAVFEAFIHVPEHHGTNAMVEAWRRHAGRLAGRLEWSGEVSALARAWVLASDSQSAFQVSSDLIQVFRRSHSWFPLLALLDELPDDQRRAFADAEYEAAIAVRRPDRALSVLPDGPHHGVVRAMRRATRLPWDAVRARVLCQPPQPGCAEDHRTRLGRPST